MAVTSPSALRHSGAASWFPSWFIWALFFVTSAFRVHYVTQPKNWWVMHPDEVYQTMEVAHTEVYGYGFRAYEFNPPLYEFDTATPEVRKQEQIHGMAALRSYILPHFYVTVTWLLSILGLHFHPFLTWKVAHTLVASTLVLAVYRYVIVVFRSRDTACLAAILCAACAQLHVLGTHTLVNSLLAPSVILALSHLHNLVAPRESVEKGDHTKTNGVSSQNINSQVETNKGIYPRNNSSSLSSSSSSSAQQQYNRQNSKNKGKQKNNHKTNGKQQPSKSSSSYSNGSVQNNNLPTALNGTPYSDAPVSNGRTDVIRNDVNGNTKTHNGFQNGAVSNGHFMNPSERHQNGNLEAGHNGLLKHFSNQNRNGGKRESESAAAESIGGIGQSYGTTNNNCSGEGDREESKNFARRQCGELLVQILCDVAAGLVLGVCVYVRIDISAFAVATLLPHWLPRRTRYPDVILCILGALGGVGVGVAYDFRCYGWGVLAPVNWFRFNVQRDYSSLLFGTDPSYKYLVDVFAHNFGVLLLCVLSVCCASQFSRSLEKRISKHFPSTDEQSVVKTLGPKWRSQLLKVCISWLLLLALYSSKGHKELRFVHNVIVLVLITCSVLIQSSLLKYLPSRTQQRRVLAVGVAIFLLSQWHDVSSLVGDRTRGGNKMAFQRDGDTQDVNQCLYKLSSRNDVTGVFLDRNLYASAGYTLLHKEVPIFCFFGRNFQEYSLGYRLREPKKFPFHIFNTSSNFQTTEGENVPRSSDEVLATYVGKFSNFVTRMNSNYVLQFVLKDPRYNMFIMHQDKGDFSLIGLSKSLFSCGVYRVYKRPANPTPEQAARLKKSIDTPPPRNATILLHEADMLFFHGAWASAVDRFRLVLRVDPEQVGAYLPLASSVYHRDVLSNPERASQLSFDVMNECYEKFGRERCETKRDLMTELAHGGGGTIGINDYQQ